MSSTHLASALVARFEHLRMTDVEAVGGKNASLGEMISQLAASVMPGWRDIVPLLSRGAALEVRGRVETIERETRTIRISSGFLGLTSVALVVTEDTLIVVGEKEGGFGDIRPGEPVVAAYEVGRGALQAKRVEVVRPAKPSGN